GVGATRGRSANPHRDRDPTRYIRGRASGVRRLGRGKRLPSHGDGAVPEPLFPTAVQRTRPFTGPVVASGEAPTRRLPAAARGHRGDSPRARAADLARSAGGGPRA